MAVRKVLAFGRWSVGAGLCPARLIFSFCLRRVTFFLWRKKVTKERHSRGKGFRFPPERALRVRLTIFAKQKSVF